MLHTYSYIHTYYLDANTGTAHDADGTSIITDVNVCGEDRKVEFKRR